MGWGSEGGIGGGVGLGGGGGQDFVKIQKKKLGGLGGRVWGGQDGCERRIEVFVKIKKIYIFFFFLGGGVG